MVSRAVARGFATHNLPNWTRCGYVLHPQQWVCTTTTVGVYNYNSGVQRSPTHVLRPTITRREMEEQALLNWAHTRITTITLSHLTHTTITFDHIFLKELFQKILPKLDLFGFISEQSLEKDHPFYLVVSSSKCEREEHRERL